MSLSRLRYLAGTARQKLQAHVRRAWGRIRRTPPCAQAVVRPTPVRRGATALTLTHALLASDLNPRYLELWPIVRQAWSRIAGLEPILVLVADRQAVPIEMATDPAVVVFEPVPSLDTALQAQCIRLLYPALMETPGAVITSDVDMAPMNHRYFHRPLTRIDRAHFVCYRDLLLPLRELPICYNAAAPRTWASVFGIEDIDGVYSRLVAWGEGVEYAGTHGGTGWTTDQRQLYEILLARGRCMRDVWILDDAFTGYRRLERTYIEKWGTLSDAARRGIERGSFSDFHLLRADSPSASLNERVIEAAIQATKSDGAPLR